MLVTERPPPVAVAETFDSPGLRPLRRTTTEPFDSFTSVDSTEATAVSLDSKPNVAPANALSNWSRACAVKLADSPTKMLCSGGVSATRVRRPARSRKKEPPDFLPGEKRRALSAEVCGVKLPKTSGARV